MSGHDLFVDGYPHGTLDGFNGGCRGGACPGALDYDLSCKQAKILHSSDIRYDRLVAAGKTPAEISDIINGRTPTTPTPTPTTSPEEPTMTKPAPKPAPPKKTLTEAMTKLVAAVYPLDAAQPLAESSQDAEPQEDAGGEPAIETEAPAEGTPVAEAEEMGHHNFEVFPKRKSPAGPSQSTMREWARNNGIDVNPRGAVRKEVVDAYLAAHAEAEPLTPAEYSEALDQTRERIDDNQENPIVRLQREIEKVTTEIIDALAEDAELVEKVIAAVHADEQHHADVAAMFAEDVAAAEQEAVDELRRRLAAGAHHDPVAEAKATQPEWADVTVSEDVERARRIAVSLEQELLRVEAERDTAQAALELTLHKWSQERLDKGAARISLAIVQDQLHEAHHLIYDLATLNDILTRVVEASFSAPAPRTPWWKRSR